MSRLSLLPVLLCLSLSGCIIHINGESGDDWNWTESYAHRGSGIRSSEERPVGDFKRLRFVLSGEVRVRVGSATHVELSCDDNLIGRVRTRVVDGELVIDSDNESLRFREGLRIEITTPALESASLSGSGSLTLEGLAGERFEANLSGSGKIVARGQVQRASLSVSGSGDLRCSDLAADEVQISISGSGDARVQAAKRLSVSISGSGSVRYTGSPADVTRSIAGSGTIAPE